MFSRAKLGQLRRTIRRSPYFRHLLALKRARSEGFRRTAIRHRLWSRILESAPVRLDRVSDGSQIELHIMCYWRDYLCAMWALKSFYHFSAVRYPLAIHIQGFTTGTMLRRLRKHFPDARIIPQAEADPEVEAWLAKHELHHLLARRQTNPFILRLCDFSFFCRAPYLLMFDSDVLFVDRPSELLAPPEEHPAFVFMRDCTDGYTISADEARRSLGIDLAHQVNAGIAIIKRAALDLKRCNELLGYDAIVNGDPSLLDQTLYALIASESKQLWQLPATYYLSLEIGRSFAGIIARHYAGDSRPLLTSEGLPHLIATGFLQTAFRRHAPAYDTRTAVDLQPSAPPERP